MSQVLVQTWAIGLITPAQPGACSSVPVQQGPYLSSGLSRADPRRATATLGEEHSGTPTGPGAGKSWPAELWQVGAIGQPVPGVSVPGEEEKWGRDQDHTPHPDLYVCLDLICIRAHKVTLQTCIRHLIGQPAMTPTLICLFSQIGCSNHVTSKYNQSDSRHN